MSDLDITVKQFVVGPVATNCYFAIHNTTKEMLVIDPGDQAKLLKTEIAKTGATPVAILLTHGHFDHATAAKEISESYGIKIYAQESEKETLESSRLNLSGPMMGNPMVYHADHYLKDEEEIDLAGFHIRVLHTPGHTTGGACYYFPNEMVLFSGDSLFCESVGRTDFPGGSASTLIRALKEKIMPLPDFVKVYPGHNEITSIEHERAYNPYV